MSDLTFKSYGSTVQICVSFLAATLLLAACFVEDQDVNLKKNENVTQNPVPLSGGDLIEVDSYEFVDELFKKDLQVILPTLGLQPLQNTDRPNKFEFRLWTNSGTRLLAVLFDGIENKAYFFEIKTRSNEVTFNKKKLSDPKSGWNKLIFNMKGSLTTPKGLVRDPQFSLSRDEPVIYFEVVERGEYRRVFYGHRTPFPDGTKLISVCGYLASEFDVDLACNGTAKPQ